jgi:hypothetical protein
MILTRFAFVFLGPKRRTSQNYNLLLYKKSKISHGLIGRNVEHKCVIRTSAYTDKAT